MPLGEVINWLAMLSAATAANKDSVGDHAMPVHSKLPALVLAVHVKGGGGSGAIVTVLDAAAPIAVDAEEVILTGTA